MLACVCGGDSDGVGDVGDCGFSGDIVGECTWASPMSVTLCP